MCSPIEMPGTVVAIGLNSPRYSTGAVGLHVPRVDGAQPAVEEDEDQGNVAGRRLPSGRRGLCDRPGLKQARQRQAHAGQARDPQPEEIPADDPVAERVAVRHGDPPVRCQ